MTSKLDCSLLRACATIGFSSFDEVISLSSQLFDWISCFVSHCWLCQCPGRTLRHRQKWGKTARCATLSVCPPPPPYFFSNDWNSSSNKNNHHTLAKTKNKKGQIVKKQKGQIVKESIVAIFLIEANTLLFWTGKNDISRGWLYEHEHTHISVERK